MYCVLSSSQLLNLFADDKALSSDFVNHKPLTDGELPEFCGFKIITYDYLPYIESYGLDLTGHLEVQRAIFEQEMVKPKTGEKGKEQEGEFDNAKSKAEIKQATDLYVDGLQISSTDKNRLKESFDAFTSNFFLKLREHLTLDQIIDLMNRSQRQVSADVYCFCDDVIHFGKVSGLDRNQIIEDPKDHNNWYIYVEEYIAVARANEKAIVCIKCLDMPSVDNISLSCSYYKWYKAV